MKIFSLTLALAFWFARLAGAQTPEAPEAPAASPAAASGSAPTAFIPALPPGPTPPAPLEERPELIRPPGTSPASLVRPSPEEARAAATLGNILASGDLVLPITGTVTIPSNSLAVVNLTIVTNVNVTYQLVTNVYPVAYILTTPPSGILTPLVGNVINPAAGRRLVKTITAATGLTINPFNDTNWATVYLLNPNRYPVTWPGTNQVNYRGGNKPGQPPDPSDPYPIVYFESVFGRIIATQ